jgi:hypothetical protein
VVKKTLLLLTRSSRTVSLPGTRPSTTLLQLLAGTAVYTLFLRAGPGPAPVFITGIVWLLELQKLYKIGRLRALLIAVIIWIVTSVAGRFLPVL